MTDGRSKASVRTRDIVIEISRIQTVVARTAHSAKFIIKTSSGREEVDRPIVNKLIDLAYIERIQVTTDRIVIQTSGNRTVVQRVDPLA
jgi:hypothetical protein